MKKITVQVREDHLASLSRAKPIAAVAELIWNALDADASEVRVEFEENALGGVETLFVRDNGSGLPHERALREFENLGGSWKRAAQHTHGRRRMLHGQYGKGRFRAFGLGARVAWTSTYQDGAGVSRFIIVGRLETLGEFELSDPGPAEPDAAPGMCVEIIGLDERVNGLRGVKAREEITDLFALYLRQYPDTRIVYDGAPLDPATVEDRTTEGDLGEFVMENGARTSAVLTIVEWTLPGKRGIVLCDEQGFALEPARPRPVFRGFSYTAYLKSAHLKQLEHEGLLQVEDLAGDVRVLVEAARQALRKHFAKREEERARDLIALWRENGLYPYEGEPANEQAALERRIFDIYAVHLANAREFAETPQRAKRLTFRMLQELVALSPTRVARVVDEMLSFPEAKEAEIRSLTEE